MSSRPSVQQVVWLTINTGHPGRVMLLAEIVEEVNELWTRGPISYGAVNAALERLERAGEVVKFKAPDDSNVWQACFPGKL